MQPDAPEATTAPVIMLAPTGRDAELARKVLASAGVPCRIAADIEEIAGSIASGGAALAIVAEEALDEGKIERLRGMLQSQPPWSDFPFIILTTGGTSTALTLRRYHALQALGQITLLERPLRMVTLVAAVDASLLARKRQYELRDYLAERQEAERALIAQAEELARNNAELQQFAYITSHDLKEPIRSVLAYAQLLGRRHGDQLDEEGREFIDYIVSGARRMHDLVQDLLAYSRFSHPEKDKQEVVSLDQAVELAAENLQSAIADSGAEIEREPLPNVLADHIHLVQLFQNLLSNAIKYRRDGVPPRVTIATRHIDGEWVITVEDNGVGFKPEYAERIFGMFKRLHGQEIAGTGIGLAICRKIVERYGGRIWARGEPGRGATFSFTLPGMFWQAAARSMS